MAKLSVGGEAVVFSTVGRVSRELGTTNDCSGDGQRTADDRRDCVLFESGRLSIWRGFELDLCGRQSEASLDAATHTL